MAQRNVIILTMLIRSSLFLSTRCLFRFQRSKSSSSELMGMLIFTILQTHYQILMNSIHNQPFASLKQSEVIQIRGDGLFAIKKIEPFTTILRIKNSETICYSNVNHQFRQLFGILKGKCIVSKSTNIKKEIDYQNEIFLLHLIYLKNNERHPCFQRWFSRPLTALYFFQRKAVEQTENLDLLIDYVAEHNHLHSVCQFLYSFLQTTRLQILMGRQPIFQDFKKDYEWSYHFINNRSFGYTQQYTLIPVFDMINHSSHNSNVHQILSNSEEIEMIKLKEMMDVQPDHQLCESDNEEQIEKCTQAKTTLLSSRQFYYHIVSSEVIQAGEQIFIQYGNRNNKFLLEGYGFVQELNPYDSFIIYPDVNSDKIYFDSVKGQGMKSYKLKRKIFNFQFLVDMKKQYFKKYYKKEAQKAKILWSKPKDKQFQLYFISSLAERMLKNKPILHVINLDLKGGYELSKYQSEQYGIYMANMTYLVHLLYLMSVQISNEMTHLNYKDKSLPFSLKQYANLLVQL